MTSTLRERIYFCERRENAASDSHLECDIEGCATRGCSAERGGERPPCSHCCDYGEGTGVFAPIYRQHAALIRRTLQRVSSEEQFQMEEVLERIVRRDEELGEQEVHHWDRISTVFKCSLQPGDSQLIQNQW